MKSIFILWKFIEGNSRNSMLELSANRAAQLKLQYSMNKGNS